MPGIPTENLNVIPVLCGKPVQRSLGEDAQAGCFFQVRRGSVEGSTPTHLHTALSLKELRHAVVGGQSCDPEHSVQECRAVDRTRSVASLLCSSVSPCLFLRNAVVRRQIPQIFDVSVAFQQRFPVAPVSGGADGCSSRPIVRFWQSNLHFPHMLTDDCPCTLWCFHYTSPLVSLHSAPTNLIVRLGMLQSNYWDFKVRSMSRFTSRAFIDSRLSAFFLPRAMAKESLM